MREEAHPSFGYNFNFAGGIHNSYLFVTLQNITYEILFKPTPYLFGEGFILADEIVELVIKVADNPTDRRPPLDSLIAPTVNTKLAGGNSTGGIITLPPLITFVLMTLFET